MNVSGEIVRLRRFLRDPDANIWSNDLLLGIWNEIQNDLQSRTRILEDVAVLPIPPRFQHSYMHECEREFAGDNAYRCLFHQEGHFAFTTPSEVQQAFGVAGNTTAAGTTYTHPLEAWFETPAYPPRIPLPSNFHSAKGVYHDEIPIPYVERRQIEKTDPSWRSRSGVPNAYTRESDEDNQILLYPRPSTVVWNAEVGEGMVTSVSGDTTGAEVGVISQRTGNLLTDESGFAVSVLDAADNVVLPYVVEPTEVDGVGSELDFPAFLTKYIRWGTLERAYQANTDGLNPDLARHWGRRYKLGLKAIGHYKSIRSRDRNRRFVSESAPAIRRRIRHPRLPDGYPDA